MHGRDTKNSKTQINNGYWLRKSLNIDGVPADCVNAYCKLLSSVTAYFHSSIEEIFEKKDKSKITIPVDINILMDYASGFEFEFRPFCNWLNTDKTKEGFWEMHAEKPYTVIIHYNECAPKCRQQYTIVHELIHFLQRYDAYFIAFLDELIYETTLPSSVILKVLERGTDKAAAFFLMPEKHFTEKFYEIQQREKQFTIEQLKELAQSFLVSEPSAKYRLQECGIYVPT